MWATRLSGFGYKARSPNEYSSERKMNPGQVSQCRRADISIKCLERSTYSSRGIARRLLSWCSFTWGINRVTYQTFEIACGCPTSRPHLSISVPQTGHIVPPHRAWCKDVGRLMIGNVVLPHLEQRSGSKLMPQRFLTTVP